MSAAEDEVRRLDQRIDEVTDETLESTRRMLNMAVETNQIGVDTLVTLNEQGQRLSLHTSLLLILRCVFDRVYCFLSSVILHVHSFCRREA